MNEVERQIQFEKECRELWRAVHAAVSGGVTTRTKDVPVSWADDAVKEYRKRFASNEK
jgi:hypothetical protein